MRIALSPCPNDTFTFYAWIHGLVAPPPTFDLADIQHLNEKALTGEYDVIKVSAAMLPSLSDTYQLLTVGAALGFGCGPLLIGDENYTSIAIPGQLTTAHALLNRLMPRPAEKVFCTYDETEELLYSGRVDAAVIIHEQRFTHRGHLIADLGAVWEEQLGLPVPLGCIVAKHDVADEATRAIGASLDYAHQHPRKTDPFVQNHSINRDPEVIAKHIATYVNQETRQLSATGRQAIETLTDSLCPSP